MEVSKIDSIIRQNGGKESAILSILQDVQAKEKYLPKEALEYIGEKLHIPLNKIYRIATFYRAFSLSPRGKHEVCVCMGTACHVRGAQRIVDQIKLALDIRPGETTKDKNFTLETVNCLGVCAAGPVVAIDGQYFGKLSPAKVDGTLKKFRSDKKKGGDE
ncbi:MAG: NAD(P)H-dependent oxidoreductase subunit E [Desulfobacterales bacterium]|jgi:NADH-quinone oxidoreductase subunit E|nr:NAD(P)H-dependent oxidoreductase subunit E [Desulfobacterales bacterium]